MTRTNTVALSLLSILFTACGSIPHYGLTKRNVKETQGRISVGAVSGNTKGTLTDTVSAERVSEDDSSDVQETRGRLEINRKSALGPTVGLYYEAGLGNFDWEEIDTRHVTAGIVMRHYFTESQLRPFAEVRAGYRHTWLDAGIMGSDDGGGFDGGLGAGLEYSVSRDASVFALIEYNYSTANLSQGSSDLESDTNGVGLMIGGAFNW